MIRKLASSLGMFKPALVLALLPLTAGLCHAASISYTNSGILLGQQTLPQFNSSLGTLTSATFLLFSTAGGSVTMQGTQGDGVCNASSGASVTVAIAGGTGDLSNSLNIPIAGIVGNPPGCTASFAFVQPMNAGPTPGVGPLNGYVGTGTLPFVFTTSPNLNNAVWNGSLTVTYNYNPLNSPTPEPSSALLLFSGMMGLVLARRQQR